MKKNYNIEAQGPCSKIMTKRMARDFIQVTSMLVPDLSRSKMFHAKDEEKFGQRDEI